MLDLHYIMLSSLSFMVCIVCTMIETKAIFYQLKVKQLPLKMCCNSLTIAILMSLNCDTNNLNCMILLHIIEIVSSMIYNQFVNQIFRVVAQDIFKDLLSLIIFIKSFYLFLNNH